jgi:hypothetical protein
MAIDSFLELVVARPGHCHPTFIFNVVVGQTVRFTAQVTIIQRLG